MTANESLNLDYVVFSSPDSSSVLTHEDGHNKISNIIAPFLFTFLSMTTVPTLQANDISMVSQPVTVCQTIDISEPISKEEILKLFVSKLVLESKDIDPEIAEIVNKNYRDLLW
jgi:hypothetical protein